MNRDHFFVLFHAVADAFVKFQSDAVIDLVFFPFPAAPEHGQRCAKVFTIRSGKVSRTRGSNFRVKPRLRQAVRFIHDARVSSLQADSLAQFFERLPGRDHRLRQASAFFHALRPFAKKKHPRGKLQAQLTQVRRSAALEHFHRLPHFIRMTRHLPQWLVHVGDQRYHFLAHALPGLNHDLRQPGRILFLFHERPGPRLYVQHQRIDSFGKFLAHDGCRDEPDVLDRRGDIT